MLTNSVFLIGSAWENAADDKVVNKFSKRLIEAIDKKAKAKGLHYPFVYLNDAGPDQKPFKLYGQGKSLQKMKAIRDKYGAFRTLSACPTDLKTSTLYSSNLKRSIFFSLIKFFKY